MCFTILRIRPQLTASPLLTTTLLSAPEAHTTSTLLLFQEALSNVLLGTFVALGMIGLLLWRSIPFSAATTEESPEKPS